MLSTTIGLYSNGATTGGATKKREDRCKSRGGAQGDTVPGPKLDINHLCSPNFPLSQCSPELLPTDPHLLLNVTSVFPSFSWFPRLLLLLPWLVHHFSPKRTPGHLLANAKTPPLANCSPTFCQPWRPAQGVGTIPLGWPRPPNPQSTSRLNCINLERRKLGMAAERTGLMHMKRIVVLSLKGTDRAAAKNPVHRSQMDAGRPTGFQSWCPPLGQSQAECHRLGLKPPKTTEKRLFRGGNVCKSNCKITQCELVALSTALLTTFLNLTTGVHRIALFLSKKGASGLQHKTAFLPTPLPSPETHTQMALINKQVTQKT